MTISARRLRREIRGMGGMGYQGAAPTFHPDSWDFDASTYSVRDAGEETIADMAAFYGGTVHDINVLNVAKYSGDPAKYGKYAGTIINMPTAFRDRALAMDCPAGFSRDSRGYCVVDTTKGKMCPAGQAVNPADGLCYDPAKGGPPPPVDPTSTKWSTAKKVGVGLGIAGASVGILVGGVQLYKHFFGTAA